MPEPCRTFQPNSAQSRQEVTQQNNSCLIFKIKHSMLTPAQKSEKKKTRQVQALLLFLWSGTLCVVFITYTCNCGREWLCNYRATPAVWQCCAMPDSKCSLLDSRAKPDQSWNAANLHPVESRSHAYFTQRIAITTYISCQLIQIWTLTLTLIYGFRLVQWWWLSSLPQMWWMNEWYSHFTQINKNNVLHYYFVLLFLYV